MITKLLIRCTSTSEFLQYKNTIGKWKSRWTLHANVYIDSFFVFYHTPFVHINFRPIKEILPLNKTWKEFCRSREYIYLLTLRCILIYDSNWWWRWLSMTFVSSVRSSANLDTLFAYDYNIHIWSMQLMTRSSSLKTWLFFRHHTLYFLS